MEYEDLLKEVYEEGIHLDEAFPFESRLKGLYMDGNIALSDKLRKQSEKTCILAEELGHYHTSSGNILDSRNISSRKQEYRARMWAYNHLIGLYGIVDCYRANCRNLHEMAEYLGVTEEFLAEALNCFHNKYGICKKFDNYIIYFEPNLNVLEFIS